MFSITDNMFFENGICKYEDEWGNTIFMKRKGDGFVAKLRFYDESVKASPIYYDPHDESSVSGAYLHLDLYDGRDREEEEISEPIKGFTEIVQRWIYMLSDIILFGADNKVLQSMKPGLSDEDAWASKVALLRKYEELTPMLNGIFGCDV